MRVTSRLIGKGPSYLFRGLREGDVAFFALGAALVLIRLGRRNRGKQKASITLKAGESVALRVTRPGADPVAYRIDA